MKPMTAVLVLRTVPVSDDGITIRAITKGTTDHVLSELFDGLKAEGYVIEVGDEAEAPAASLVPAGDAKPTLPADWRALHHIKMIPLAKAFDDTVSTKAHAIEVLEAAEKAAAEASQA